MAQKVVQKIGKYEILSELGQGGMGTVYKARDPLIARLVALKTVNPELISEPEILQRFYREAQAAGGLQHPNIVTVFDLGEFEGHPYIAMEFVEGESLQSIINRQAKMPLAAKLKLAEQVCMGLDHAHKSGIVHRDVKPGNILVKNDGTVKVVDFGIVHLESTTLTKTGMFMGTIQYASPEQLNEGKVDQRSDLWSVVCVIYELIAYKKPFEAGNFGAMVGKILNTEPEILSHACPEVPAALDDLIAKGLKKKVADRYQSLEELLVDLVPIGQSLQKSQIPDLLAEARQLKEKGDLHGAQEKVRTILIFERSHGEAKRLNSEITAELLRLSSLPRVRELASEGEQAFKRGEYADAIRALTGALELNPNDTASKRLKDKATLEQDRQRQVHEALIAGQKALKQGDLTGAEVELKKVLDLDRSNAQASAMLSEIRQDRSGREKDFGLKEILWKVDSLISEGKYEEAQVELAALQKDYPDELEVQQKLQQVNSHLTESTLPMGFPVAGSASEKAQWREAKLTEATQSLEKNDLSHATMVIGSVKDRFPADPKVEALAQKLEKKKTETAAPKAPPASAVKAGKPRQSFGMILGGIALAAALGIGAFFYFHRAQPAAVVAVATPEEIQLEHDAKLLQGFSRDAALDKWRKLASMNGPLQAEAQQYVKQITDQQDTEKQETTFFSQGMEAQQAKKWTEAMALYQKVVDLKGPMMEQAQQAISSVKELQAGASLATLEKEKYERAVDALNQQDYAQARVLFQQVVDLKAPGSTLAAKAQAQLETVKATELSQKQFAAADKAQSGGDLNAALAEFQEIASKPGAFQAQAQQRIQQINDQNAATQKKQQAEKALQDNLKKFKDLESQKKFADAAALLPAITQLGGDGTPLKNGLEAAEQADLQNLSNQFNQAKNNKDVAALQQLKGQFQALAAGSGTPAGSAHDFAENQIPAAITQINLANQPKPAAAAPPPPARVPQVALIPSGENRPWSRSVQRGMLVPDYNVDGGLKPLIFTVPPVQGAPAGSMVMLKINIDENGNVSPDIVLQDPSGMGPTVMDAAKKWRFSPPMAKGTPVKTSVAVKVTF